MVQTWAAVGQGLLLARGWVHFLLWSYALGMTTQIAGCCGEMDPTHQAFLPAPSVHITDATCHRIHSSHMRTRLLALHVAFEEGRVGSGAGGTEGEIAVTLHNGLICM